MVTRYRIAHRGGVLVGAVMGMGGFLDGRHGLERLRRAADGGFRRNPVNGDDGGAVFVFPDFSAASDGRVVKLDIVGASVEVAS